MLFGFIGIVSVLNRDLRAQSPRQASDGAYRQIFGSVDPFGLVFVNSIIHQRPHGFTRV